MIGKRTIFAIIGSASENSSSEKLIENFSSLTKDVFRVKVFNRLKTLPHFDPQLAIDNPPLEVVEFRQQIEHADGILICTPEYVFSIPSGLKNAIEWCVSTTVFSDKPIGLITASAHGEKGHEELKRIMTTVMTKFNNDTTVLIQGVKGKINAAGVITDNQTKEKLEKFVNAFKDLLKAG